MGDLPTQDQIRSRLVARKDGDFFGFEVSEYAAYLDFDLVREFLKDGATREDWANETLMRETVLKKMYGYMPFAWGKANDMRGLSAGRSIAHFVAWTWLAGDEDLSKELEEPYEFYGKPHLIKICEHYGWDWKQWDDGERTNG